MIFARHSLAESAAIQLASKASSTGRAAFVPFTGRIVIRAEDGNGPAYSVRPCHGGRSPDYELVELTVDEVNERVRRGMLREADDLDEEANANEDIVAELRRSGKERQRMLRLAGDAERYRVRAAALRSQVERGTFVDLLASCGAADEKAQGAA